MKLASVTCSFLIRSFQILLKPGKALYPDRVLIRVHTQSLEFWLSNIRDGAQSLQTEAGTSDAH